MKNNSPIQAPKIQAGKPEITMAPLIDVVFLLLIFFMVTTVFPENHALIIDKPESAASDAIVAKKISFVISKTGEVEFNKQAIKIEDIETIVRDQLRVEPGTAVLIKIDKKAATEIFIQVLDACKLGGAKQIGIATDARIDQ